MDLDSLEIDPSRLSEDMTEGQNILGFLSYLRGCIKKDIKYQKLIENNNFKQMFDNVKKNRDTWVYMRKKLVSFRKTLLGGEKVFFKQ